MTSTMPSAASLRAFPPPATPLRLRWFSSHPCCVQVAGLLLNRLHGVESSGQVGGRVLRRFRPGCFQCHDFTALSCTWPQWQRFPLWVRGRPPLPASLPIRLLAAWRRRAPWLPCPVRRVGVQPRLARPAGLPIISLRPSPTRRRRLRSRTSSSRNAAALSSYCQSLRSASAVCWQTGSGWFIRDGEL
jgi:hypothetical protein